MCVKQPRRQSMRVTVPHQPNFKQIYIDILRLVTRARRLSQSRQGPNNYDISSADLQCGLNGQYIFRGSYFEFGGGGFNAVALILRYFRSTYLQTFKNKSHVYGTASLFSASIFTKDQKCLLCIFIICWFYRQWKLNFPMVWE